MVKNFIVTGDTHGAVIQRLEAISRNMKEYKQKETGIIILGDVGLNFYLNKTDYKQKKYIASHFKYTLYCVRGNHEARPDDLELIPHWDHDIGNFVRIEKDFPTIKYLYDGGIYNFNGHKTLVIGGAYSVDKCYRLNSKGILDDSDPDYYNPKKTGWFHNECLTPFEMKTIEEGTIGHKFDFVLSHTCPLDWEPTDLFLGCVDQSTVDKSMEIWMNDLKEKIDWKMWLFGHFHADRIERPCVEQMYTQFDDLEAIWNHWYGEKTYNSAWWLPKSPYMRAWVEETQE